MQTSALWLMSTLALTAVLSTVASARKEEPAMYMAANTFLATLNPEQKKKAMFPFNSEERLNWHFIPKERLGLTYKEMTADQQKAAIALLQVGLSKAGYKKVDTIRHLENVLKEMENGSPTRDPDKYYFSIFGEPSEKGTWGWRYEGHHVSLHWTALEGKIIASTPQFLGSNPGEVRSGPMRGTRVLAAEEDLGRALVTALTPEQRKEAVLDGPAPGDIITGAQRKAAILEDKGIAYKSLAKDQQGIFLTLLREYAGTQAAPIAKKRLDAVRKAGLDTIKFAWMGSLERGQGHYYRIQGATFLIEYDNTQNNANHVHSVWRDFKGDFGADLLEEHYKHADAGHGHDH